MTRLANAFAVTALMSSAMWAMPAFAEMGAANPGSGEAPRAAPGAPEYEFGRAKPIAPPKLEAEESRAAPMTDEKAVESYTVLTRSADGKVTRSAPGDKLRGAVIEEMKKEERKGESKIERSADPAFSEGEEANRLVVGPDDRVQISNTKIYPFTSFGYIEGKSKGGFGGCSGTLIGPRTVITAAHCLYSNDDKDWLSEIIYAPALNSFENAPFGAFPAESVSILEGFTTNYQGYYGSVIQWDLGIITLAEPVGDNLGWLAYSNYDDLGDFDANIVGYPGDKPGGTMWRATCKVMAENIAIENFSYDCDTYAGSSGSAVYAYDAGTKQRVVVGVNIAENPQANTAIRLNTANVEWINGLWK